MLTLTLLDAGQLLQLAVEALDIPPHIVSAGHDGGGEIAAWIVRDHPINVTVFGDHLEELHTERNFFQLDADTVLETLWRPINGLEMHVAIFLGETDQTIGFQCGVENTIVPVN